jgi:Mg-chelatase subunit ChlD
MLEARRHGVAVSTLLLGSDDDGRTILRGLATGTGGRFFPLSDFPIGSSSLPALNAIGVEKVMLRVNDSPPVLAELAGGAFTGRLPLRRGVNRIQAIAIGPDGRRATDSVTVSVGPPGCAELKLRAVSRGKSAVTISERSVEIVFDASRSMWGRVGGRPKIEVAKEILSEVLGSARDDLRLGLRVYGHRQGPARGGCRDSELLVPITSKNRAPVLQAISGLRPRGQTPLAHVLGRIGGDFGDRPGARAVVLVTDGIETCGGDPVKAAGALGSRGTPVHVIGFGLESEEDEDAATLRAIARVSGGSFFVASSGRELRSMLGRTVASRFRVFRGDAVVAEGAVGSEEAIRLPGGPYRVRVESSPPREVSLGLPPETGVTLVLQRRGREVGYSLERHPVEYATCTGEQLARSS